MNRVRELPGSKIDETEMISHDSHENINADPSGYAKSTPTLKDQEAFQSLRHEELILNCEISSDKNTLTIIFRDGQYAYHAQWLHDAQCMDGASRTFATAFCQQLLVPPVHLEAVSISGAGFGQSVSVTWDHGNASRFPAPWLRVMAPLVASHNDPVPTAVYKTQKGWLANTLMIPEISYEELFPEHENTEAHQASVLRTLNLLLHESASGIIKVTNTPPPNLDQERQKTNTVVTRVLKQLFGAVFVHPRRGADKTFNVASHNEDAKRGSGLEGLVNYDTNQILLHHCDHAHYENPARVQGWYGLEGESENVFVSALAAVATLKDESPELFEPLCNAPMAVGRVAHFYEPALFQGTVDTAVTKVPGYPNDIKRVRWHPHLTGSLLAPFHKYHEARLAHQRFQEIMRRKTHMVTVLLKPGDLYIWDNHRVLHGRERVVKVPRTGVGQIVPEQVVSDKYRELQVRKLTRDIDEKWLVHMPNPQLHDLIKILGG